MEGQFPTLDATCIPVSRSNGQRSWSSGPLMLTHIVRHILLSHTAGAPKRIQSSLFSPQLQPQRCVEYYDFNAFNWCSGHFVIANQCWIKYYCHPKVITTIFISDNHRISKAITAHLFKLAKILSTPLMLIHIVRLRTARPTNFKLGERMEDDDRINHRRHDLQGQRSRSQGHVISLSRLGTMLYLCH